MATDQLVLEIVSEGFDKVIQEINKVVRRMEFMGKISRLTGKSIDKLKSMGTDAFKKLSTSALLAEKAQKRYNDSVKAAQRDFNNLLKASQKRANEAKALQAKRDKQLLAQQKEAFNNIKAAQDKINSEQKKAAQAHRARMEKLSNVFKKLKADMLALGLAFLFTGMAIKKFFGDLTKAAWNTFSSIADQSNVLMQKTSELQAGWEYLKYSIVDSLAQSELFMNIVNWVQQLIDRINNLSPQSKKTIGEMLIGFTVLGAVMMTIGMALLFLQGVFNATSLIAIGAIALITAEWVLLNDELTPTASKFEGVGLAIAGIGAAMILLITGPIGWLVLAFGALIFVIGQTIQKQGTWKNFFISTIQAMMKATNWLGDTIYDALIFPMHKFLETIYNTLDALDKFGIINVSDSVFKALDTALNILDSPKTLGDKLLDYNLSTLEAMKDPVEDVTFMDKAIARIKADKDALFSALGITAAAETGAVAELGYSTAYNDDGTFKDTTPEAATPMVVTLSQETMDSFFAVSTEAAIQGAAHGASLTQYLPGHNA